MIKKLLILFFFISLNTLFSQEEIYLSIESSFSLSIIPYEIQLGFTIYSESDKGNVPIDNIESILRKDFLAKNISIHSFQQSKNQQSVGQVYRNYTLTIRSEEDFIKAHKVLYSNPFVQGLKVVGTKISAEQLKDLNERSIKGIWEKNKKEATTIANSAYKKIVGVESINATKAFDYTKYIDYIPLSSKYAEKFENSISVKYLLQTDSTYKLHSNYSKIKVIGSSELKLLSESSNISFRLIYNEISKNQNGIEKVKNEILDSLHWLGVNENDISFQKIDDEDYYDFQILKIGENKLISTIGYLYKNRNIINLTISHNSTPINPKNERILYERAIQDARAKANKFSYFIDKNIDKIVSIRNNSSAEQTSGNQSEFFEINSLENWIEKCYIIFKRIVEVEFLTD